MTTTLCSCCGQQTDNFVLLIMPDLTTRRVCLKDINGMWKKFNPDMKAAKNARSSTGSK